MNESVCCPSVVKSIISFLFISFYNFPITRQVTYLLRCIEISTDLHLNVARGARQFSLSTFCLWILRYVAESARKLVKYANCLDNSVKIEFFVYSSNRILSHDASTFAWRSSKGFVAILMESEKHYFFTFNAHSMKSVSVGMKVRGTRKCIQHGKE